MLAFYGKCAIISNVSTQTKRVLTPMNKFIKYFGGI